MDEEQPVLQDSVAIEASKQEEDIHNHLDSLDLLTKKNK